MESVLYSLAGNLAGKLAGELGSPLFNNYVGKPWELGAKSELEKLNNTLSSIQAVLLDAEEKQTTNNQIKDWLIKIKLVFYDLEDLLQEVSYEALKRQVKTKNKKLKKVRIFFSRSNQLKYRFKMGRKVKLIREQLDAIASDINRFSLAPRREEVPMNRRRKETHSSMPDIFIGREEDREKVKKPLLESGGEDHSVAVISIIGIGGLGKTTLAQSIYSSEEVRCNFELMMWTCVSDPFDVKLICENIIKSVTKNEYKGLPMDVVKDKLKSLIDGKRYLLVLDDVWNESRDEWMELEDLLNGGAQGSKILITARAELVARAAKSIETHVLKGFSPEESWALFKQVAFKQGVEPQSSTIVGIAKEVAERCAGVPLAIKTIASLLGLKERDADWVDFKKNVLPVITQDSEGKIAQILKWSYDNLSAPLKRCFAYCAIFPKDWYIEKDLLIRMWMGQGLIQLDGTSRSLEDVGEQHFMELMDRSLFEVRYGNILRRYKMHDLIHDLALSVGGNEFWSDGSDVNCIDVRTRHAWFSNPGPSLFTNLTRPKKLRTLVAGELDSENNDVVITGDFKQLRVLDFYNLRADRVLEFVAGLRVLTYLDLSYSDFELLPECLCNMYNLQTLILAGCRNLKELPKGTRNLVSLRHLYVSGCYSLSHMPRGLGELTNLRTLTNFVMGPEGADCSELGELKSLVNLRGELEIRNLRGSKAGKRRSSGKRCNPTHPLAELQFITGLELYWKEDEEEKEADRELEILKPHPNLEELTLRNYRGKRIPSWMERANIGDSLPNICSIQLERCKGWRHLPVFGLLPSLRRLWLEDMGDLEYLIYDDKEEDAEGNNNNNNRYFPALEMLSIRNCPLLVVDGKQFMSLNWLCFFGDNMETLPGWLPSLPHLQTLTLTDCYNMKSLPEWMGDFKSLQEIRLHGCVSLASIPDSVLHLTSLQRLQVLGCPEFYRRYNKESGEDWHQISHIPNVSMFALPADAEEKQTTNNQIKDWLIKIKLVFYDLEDLLQEVSYEALKRQVKTKNKKAKKVRIFFSSSNQLKYRFEMGRKVKLIREQLDAIASDINRFSLAPRREEVPMNRRRKETHSFMPIATFIGREEDREKVKKPLLESGGEDHSVAVISIIGIGGLGKTTLAQSIYSSEEVRCNFELMMWVCVSDPFDVKLISENIIKTATHDQCNGLPMEVLKDKLKSLIDGKRYLLVLDDVWNESRDEWMELEDLLNGGAQGSKILITARAELVARAAKSIETHVLKGLSPEESWALFKQLAFKQGVEPQSSTIVGIAKEVVERCAGVPLAVKTIASLLGLKEREADWVDFKKNVLPVITQDSEGKIAQILKWSYDNLSAPLKRCFAYCAIFPKDWEIEKDVLIRMWMGQGLIQLDGTSRSLEDVGEQHFMELMDRSLFEVGRKYKDGTIYSCKMHDLIHDLALSVGGNEFWSNGSDVNCIDVGTRHAWFSNPGPSLSTNLTRAKKLRTLVARRLHSENNDVVITGDFKQLRVLDFRNLKAARVPEFVAGLRALTYLDLSWSDFELLPECLCNMYNLQTLILSWCSNLKELPKGTRNLVSLRHLDVSNCRKLSHMPRGLGELTNLRTLTNFVMGPVGELKSLVNLRGELTIRNLRGSKAAKRRSSDKRCNPTHPLAELQFIARLELHWCDEDDVDNDELENLKPHPNLESLELWNYGGKRIPSWMERANIGGSLPNIRSIGLWNCKGWRHLPPLGLLPSLRQLELYEMGDLEYLIYDDKEEDAEGKNNRYFPALEKLMIYNCPLLVVDGKQFMSLREVVFTDCYMETLPEWLPSLPHLQTLELVGCSEMVSLPEWMGDLKSLQVIQLIFCYSLASIPDCVSACYISGLCSGFKWGAVTSYIGDTTRKAERIGIKFLTSQTSQ